MRKLILVCCTVLVSCTVGPDYEKPNTYSDEKLAQVLNLQNPTIYPQREWYKDFKDEKLNILVEKGLNNNKDIKIAISRLKQARNSLQINSVQYLPQINAGGEYDFSKTAKNSPLPVDYDYFQAEFDASWEIDIWGAGRRLTEEYAALLNAAGANLENVKLAITAEIVTSYFSLRTAQEQLKTAKENLALQQDIFSTVKQKYESGLADDLAYKQASYVVEQTKSNIPAIQSQIEAYKNALSILVAELPDDEILNFKGINPAAKTFSFDLKKLYNYPLESLRNRPDIRIAEYNLIAKNAAIGQAVAELYPNISISALAGYQSYSGTKLFTSKSSLYGYNPAIKLPIFNWGALINNVELQKNIKEEYLQTYEQTLLNAVSEAKNATENIKNEYSRNRSLATSLRSIKDVLALTMEKYNNGLTEFSDVLQQEQNLLKANQDLINSNGAIYTNIAAFYKATGVYPYSKNSSEDRLD